MGNAHHGMTRRSLLTGATAVAAAVATGTPALAVPSNGGQVPALWREFTRTPFTHPQIPYVGRAGYRGGTARFPRRPVSAAVADVRDVRDYGAVADGTTDSAPAINRAIAAAGRAGGGTVTIPPGTFRIDDVIRVGHDNVVLRGAGSGRTTLYATKNLTELIGVYGSRYGGDQVVLVLGRRPHLACPEGPLGLTRRRHQGDRRGPSRAGPATSGTSGGP